MAGANVNGEEAELGGPAVWVHLLSASFVEYVLKSKENVYP